MAEDTPTKRLFRITLREDGSVKSLIEIELKDLKAGDVYVYTDKIGKDLLDVRHWHRVVIGPRLERYVILNTDGKGPSEVDTGRTVIDSMPYDVTADYDVEKLKGYKVAKINPEFFGKVSIDDL